MKRFSALLLGCVAFGVQAAQPLERLFFTPGERAQLDAARRQQASRVAETGIPAVGSALAVSGFVRRSDGRSTVWINDRPEPAKAVEQDGSVVVKLPNDKRRVRVKVGQSVDLVSGAVNERYRRTAPPAETPASIGTEAVSRLHGRRTEDTEASTAGDLR